ncbi:MAG: MFS transporter [Asgard group archaeon]|nr:MFS transporter [Asgard group archaeon]
MTEESKIILVEKEQNKPQVKRLGARIVAIVFMLGTVGQIAWAIENTWFNTFIYDMITPDPRPIAWMVAVSAVVATITTLFMGTLSDRTRSKFGRRKPYILFGYILWGIVTAIFPTVAYIQKIGVAIVMVIIMDAIMTFFGSTSNDAAFNAWMTDVSDSSNRNRIQGYNAVTTLIANLIALGAAGIIIDVFGYFVFFYIMGGIVTIIGLIAGLLIREPIEPIREKLDSEKKKSIFKEFIDIVKPENLKENKVLYLLFINLALIGIGSQISFPYLFIYIEHFLAYSKTDISIIGGIVIVLSGIASLLIGLFSHKVNRKIFTMIAVVLTAIFLFVFAFVQHIVLVILFYFLQLSASMGVSIVQGGWMLDRYPKGKEGKYQGVRMIFFVALPMVIGPPIGSALIRHFGYPTIIDGQSGYVPTPVIFLYSAIVTLLALIPLFYIKKEEGTIKFEPKNKLGENQE